MILIAPLLLFGVVCRLLAGVGLCGSDVLRSVRRGRRFQWARAHFIGRFRLAFRDRRVGLKCSKNENIGALGLDKVLLIW